MLTIEIPQNVEVMNRLTKELEQHGVTRGAIVSVIGAVDECTVSTMPREDASRDTLRTYTDPLEMFGSGEVRDGVPHIHAVFGTADGTAVAGHLHAATARTWFVRIYVIPDA
ncbi:PCC domain-containing protein [Streptomyces sp. NPDC003023]|uniref:PCC domain-containing protein n=1 Tax=Streptomyces sp. NPDC003023 TaxID=3364675 RepID=UPI0036A45819